MSGSAVITLVGLGLAIVSAVLPYAVKKMPSAVWIPLLALGTLMMVGPGAVWTVQRMHARKRERQAPSAPPPTGRTGYRGRPGSTGTFRATTFGSSLDTDIDNEGDVDVEDSDLR
jgi:hypothetical protein